MAVGSGLGASFGLIDESVYGTYVAPTRFHQFNKAEIKKKKNTVQGGGLAAGQLVQRGSQRVVATEAAEGSFEVEVAFVKMGVLLKHLLGSAAAPVQQGATTAYLQTFTLADNFGKSFSAQLGVPNRAGTVQAKTGKGGKITSAELSCKVNELLMLSGDVDYQKYSEVETLAAPSYVSPIPFHFGQMAVKLGTFGAEASVSGVKGVNVKFERGMDTEGFYGGAAGLKSEPVMNDWMKISGTIDVDNVNKADFADRFTADSSTSLVWEFTGPIIASTYAYTFRLKLPMIFFDDDGSTSVDGPDVISGSFPFVYEFDGTNQPMIDYISTDIAI